MEANKELNFDGEFGVLYENAKKEIKEIESSFNKILNAFKEKHRCEISITSKDRQILIGLHVDMDLLR